MKDPGLSELGAGESLGSEAGKEHWKVRKLVILGGLQKWQKRKCREQNFVRFHKVKKGMATGRTSYSAFLKKQISQLHQSHFHLENIDQDNEEK